MKKFTCVAVALVMCIMMFTACGNNASSSNEADTYPKDTINFIIPAAAGGAMETAIRQFQPYLEDELGVMLNIENLEGGSGIIGLNKMLNADADGYTISMKSEASLITNWLVNKAPFDVDSFDYLCSFTTDPGAIFVRKDAPYQTLEEFIEYTKSQPAGSVTVGISSPTDMCKLMAAQMEEQLGVDWNVVGYTGGSKARVAILNGEIDALFCNYFGSLSIVEDTTVLGIAKDENTIESLEGVPCINDALNIDIDEIDVRYVLLAPKGFIEQYPQRYEAFFNALRSALENEDYQKMMNENGYAGYIELLDSEAATDDMNFYNDMMTQYTDLLNAA